MVAFSTLVLGLSAIAASYAAPAADPLPAHVERRGPNNFFLGPDHPLMIARRNASLEARTNYVQDYKTGGTVNFSPSGDTFSLNFNTKEDFVVGIGWNPGSTSYDNLPCLPSFPPPRSSYSTNPPKVPLPIAVLSVFLAVLVPSPSTAGRPTH